jgi:cytochrome c biogenesis protein
MQDPETSKGFFDKLWNLFASVKLTVVLLLSLAVTSVIGTLIPQNQDPVAYLEAFGPVLYRFFKILGFFDLYHSWWFQLLLLLLTVNVLVCSIERLSAGRKILFVRRPNFRLNRFRNLRQRLSFPMDAPPEKIRDAFQEKIRRRFSYTRSEQTPGGYVIFAEKGRWSRFGVYTVHLSVIILLVGGLIGSIFGFDGFVTIPEGAMTNQIRLRSNNQVQPLDFSIRCDDFDVSFYENGAPKEYRSSLTIIEGGEPVLKKDIIVNDPLRYRGISIFQSSYGTMPSDEVVLAFASKATGMVYLQKMAVGESYEIPENLGTFTLTEYRKDAMFRGNPIGEAFVGSLAAANGPAVELKLPLRFPSFDKMRQGDVVISVDKFVERYYTGLQVNKDPGVWVVYFGFILIIVGCYITFFMSHRQICVEVNDAGGGSRVTLAGTANKNQHGMQRFLERLAERLAGRPLDESHSNSGQATI